MKNRLIAAMLALAMLACTVLTLVTSVFAAQDTVTVSSKEDFVKLAKSCTLDTWSRGKTVSLTCDIDFADGEFLPIPTFGGSFEGNGHTVSGIKASKSGSYTGVFRYVQSEGRISNLNVRATVTPNGSKSFVGGIVGENSGSLEGCCFYGTVKGENAVGGIAGSNTDSGRIVSCSSNGGVAGENSTGGIVGKNSGFVGDCTNNSAVNTVYEEKTTDISGIDMDAGAIIENYKNAVEENEEESVLGHSDTGGIAGYSSGIVEGCVNNANVGYRHVGYNVGGIAGRQSGYMLGCRNFGIIKGRKDVGGIVGQLEPYVLLQPSDASLKNVRQELNALNREVNRLISDTDNLGEDIELHLSAVSRYSKRAQDDARDLIDTGSDFIDDNLDEINTQSAILSNTLDKLTPIFDEIEAAGNDFSDALLKTANALDELKLNFPDLSDEISDINSALSKISNGEKSMRRAVSSAKRAANALRETLKSSDRAETDKAVSELSEAVQEMLAAKQEIKASVEEIEDVLKDKAESFEELGADIKRISECIKDIKENIDIELSALKTIKNSIDTVAKNAKFDFAELKTAAEEIKSAISYMGDAAHSLTARFKKLGNALESASDKLSDSNISNEIKSAKEGLTEAAELMSYATDALADSVGDMRDIITDLANEKPIEFVKLGDDFRSASESLFNSVSDISDELAELRNTVSRQRGSITNDLTAVSNRFNSVMNLLIDGVESIQDGINNGISDMFSDASDEDIEGTRQGKVKDCLNFGTVEADRNTGGIAGAMAIEYAKDPEDDDEREGLLSLKYRTKAVLEKCINDGKVIGKKDCTGGNVGLSEIGTVYECQNYADIESTNGNYVGGIVGKSNSTVRRSYAKCSLNGKRYIGGIAGKGDTVTDCCAIVRVDGDEGMGAVCGAADEKDGICRNFYVDNGLGAVDGISYSEKAMPIAFEELKDMNGIPRRLVSFTVTFVADGEVVETQDIKYGDETARIKYPQIPPKEGCFGKWQKPEAKTVTEDIAVECEYCPYITVLSSEEKGEGGKLPLGLCRGEFTDEAELHIEASAQKPSLCSDSGSAVYDITLLNTDIKPQDRSEIRLLNRSKGKAAVWVKNGDSWERIKPRYKGKYIVIELSGTQNSVCVKEGKGGYITVGIVSVSAVLVAAAVFFIVRRRKIK